MKREHLRKLIAKLPLSTATKNRLKEIYREWRLTVSNLQITAHLRRTDKSTVKIQRESIEHVLVGSIDDLSGNSVKLYYSIDDYLADTDQGNLPGKISNINSGVTNAGNEFFPDSDYCHICHSKRDSELDDHCIYKYGNDEALSSNYSGRLVNKPCQMNNQVKAAIDLIQHQIKIHPAETIYVTEQLTAFYQWIIKQYSNVIGSECLGVDKTGDAGHDNIRLEDFCALSFSDLSLDVIFSFGVLNLVPDTTTSINELLRVLRKGGLLIISVPFASESYQTIVRAQLTKDGDIEHFLKPEYHYNAINSEGKSLCFYDFGWDLIDKFKSAGASDAAVISYSSGDGAKNNNEQLFFMILK